MSSEVKKERGGSDNETKVIVSFPGELELSMVQANELKHYELFQWLVTLLLPIAIGFWTAHFTLNQTWGPLFWSALVFTVISILFIRLAFYYRKKVFHGSIKKSIELSQLK